MKKNLFKVALALQVGLLSFGSFGPIASVSYAATGNIKPNTPGIYSVSDGQWANSTSINIMFTYSDPDGNAQQSYQIQRSYDNWATTEFDSGEMPARTQHTLTGSRQGDNYVRVRVKDSIGDWSDWGYVHFNVDSFSPNPFTVSPIQFSNDPNGSYRILAQNVTDNIGIKRVNFQSEYNGAWTDHGNGSSTGGDQWYMDLPKRGEGLHTIKITAYDFADNYYGPVFAQYRVDTVAPSAPAVTPSTTEWTNGDVTVTISHGSDSNSGINRTEFRLDGAKDQDWTPYTGTLAITNEGQTTVTARTIDNAGNISTTTSALVKIDKTGPAGPEITPSTTDWTNQDVTVNIEPGSDAAAGINRTEYRLVGATTLNWTTYNGPITISESGETTIYARTIDNIDNISSESAYVVRIDKDPPTNPTITPSVVGWTKDNVGFTIGDSTDVNPITYEFKIGNGPYVEGASDTITDNGETVVTARAKDSLGNIGAEIPLSIYIDKEPPTISYSTSQRDWDSQDIALTINYDDTLSGVNVNKRFYKVTNNPAVPASWDIATSDEQPVTITSEGEWYVHAKVEDQVGNSASLTTSHLRLQRQPAEPANVVVSNIRENEATISWDLPAGGTLTDGFSYEVTNQTTGQTWTVSYPQNSITDNTLQGGTVYQYVVKAINHVGSSADSAPASALTLPKAPVNITAYKVDGRPDQATISFDPVESATAYRLVAKNPSNAVVYDQTVTGSVYQPIENLSPGLNYSISVSAINTTGEGASSNISFLSLPNTPGNFNTVTIQKDNIRLGWSSVTSATYYNLERDGEQIYHGSGTIFQDVGLESGTSYAYLLYAENQTGDGISGILTVMTLPAAISELQISQQTTNSFLLNWNAVKGAENYVVKVNDKTVTLGADETSYLVEGLEAGVSYPVEVYPTNTSGAGESVFNTGLTIPDIPTGMIAASEETSSVLTWSPVPGATKYRVTTGGRSQEVSGTTATIEGLEGSKSYPYTIEAGNASGYGDAASGTLLTKPHQPTNIHEAGRTEQSVELAWDADPTATVYTIIQDGVGTLATVQNSTYKIEGLTAATGYKFTIVSTNASGDSTPAVFNWVSQTLPVANVIATPGTTTAQLSWDAAEGATGYVILNGNTEIYRGTEPTAKISGLSDGQEYTFVIKALNSLGIGSTGTSVSFKQKPKTPAAVTASVTSSTVTLNLSATQVVGADEYIVERDGKEITKIPATDTSYTDSKLESRTTYKYTVKASNASGVSDGFDVTITTSALNSGGGGGGGGGGGVPPTTPPTQTKTNEGTDKNSKSSNDKGANNGSNGSKGSNSYNGSNGTSTKNEVRFTDIDKTFNKDQILELAEAGIISGVSDKSFEPNRPINRAEYVALIVRLMRLDTKQTTATMFKDVKASDWFASSIAAALAHKLVEGVSQDSFEPQAMISREQAAKIIANVLRTLEKTEAKGEVNFTDKTQISSWVLDDLAYLVEKDLIRGYEDGTFKPKNKLSRAEAVALIYNLKNYLGNR
ncbi:fibronectin type III domain-containing protein [Paenibacillus oralis]|nr:S-layer homology domain-containing protein [Paenibacillus oralis]